jgi:hypothetical protein
VLIIVVTSTIYSASPEIADLIVQTGLQGFDQRQKTWHLEFTKHTNSKYGIIDATTIGIGRLQDFINREKGQRHIQNHSITVNLIQKALISIYDNMKTF